MSGKNIVFDDKKINYYKNQKLFNIDEISVDKILVSKRELYGKKGSLKCFTGYNDDHVFRPLRIKLLSMVCYVKYFDNNKTMYFQASDIKLLKQYTKI